MTQKEVTMKRRNQSGKSGAGEGLSVTVGEKQRKTIGEAIQAAT